jgi:hypothetical protein
MAGAVSEAVPRSGGVFGELCQGTLKRRAGVADAAIDIADRENVVAILDHQAGHSITESEFSLRREFRIWDGWKSWAVNTWP